MTHSVFLLPVVDYIIENVADHPALHKSKLENALKAF